MCDLGQARDVSRLGRAAADAASVAAFAPEHGVDVRVAMERGIKPRCWRAFRSAEKTVEACSFGLDNHLHLNGAVCGKRLHSHC